DPRRGVGALRHPREWSRAWPVPARRRDGGHPRRSRTRRSQTRRVELSGRSYRAPPRARLGRDVPGLAVRELHQRPYARRRRSELAAASDAAASVRADPRAAGQGAVQTCLELAAWPVGRWRPRIRGGTLLHAELRLRSVPNREVCEAEGRAEAHLPGSVGQATLGSRRGTTLETEDGHGLRVVGGGGRLCCRGRGLPG